MRRKWGRSRGRGGEKGEEMKQGKGRGSRRGGDFLRGRDGVQRGPGLRLKHHFCPLSPFYDCHNTQKVVSAHSGLSGADLTPQPSSYCGA